MTNENLEGIKIYLFGSSLSSSIVNDIDLLLEYDERIIDVNEALRLRIEIVKILSEEFKSKIDMCLLSKTENYQTQFIKTEKGKLLQLTDGSYNSV